MSKFPEHDKLHAVQERTQAVGEFLHWAFVERHMRLMWRIEDEWRYPDGDVQDWLADWVGIDRQKLEDEKIAMLNSYRELNNERKMEDE